MIGDRRKFLSALLVPDFEALAGWAAQHGVAGREPADLIADPQVRELFRAEVDKVNADLASYEKIVAWELLPAEFTLEGGELTPTQKIKRRIVHDKYAQTIEALYSGAERSRADTVGA